jgi:hypothetical protein
MIPIPSPFVMSVVARHRADELHALADRFRLLKRAACIGAPCPQRVDRQLMATAVVALVMLLAAHAATDQDRPSDARPDPIALEARFALQQLKANPVVPIPTQERGTPRR